LLNRLQFTESCGIALLDYQTKKESLEQRAARVCYEFYFFYLSKLLIQAHERTNEETEKLKTLKEKHDEVSKHIEEQSESSKALEETIKLTEKEFV